MNGRKCILTILQKYLGWPNGFLFVRAKREPQINADPTRINADASVIARSPEPERGATKQSKSYMVIQGKMRNTILNEFWFRNLLLARQ